MKPKKQLEKRTVTFTQTLVISGENEAQIAMHARDIFCSIASHIRALGPEYGQKKIVSLERDDLEEYEPPKARSPYLFSANFVTQKDGSACHEITGKKKERKGSGRYNANRHNVNLARCTKSSVKRGARVYDMEGFHPGTLLWCQFTEEADVKKHGSRWYPVTSRGFQLGGSHAMLVPGHHPRKEYDPKNLPKIDKAAFLKS